MTIVVRLLLTGEPSLCLSTLPPPAPPQKEGERRGTAHVALSSIVLYILIRRMCFYSLMVFVFLCCRLKERHKDNMVRTLRCHLLYFPLMPNVGQRDD